MKRHVVITASAAAVLGLVIMIGEARSSGAGDSAPAPAATPTLAPAPAATPTPAATPARSTCVAPEAMSTALGTFWGCWTFFSSGPCRAVYRDAAGNYSLCGPCGPAGQPNPNNCGPVSPQTLAIGFWCS